MTGTRSQRRPWIRDAITIAGVILVFVAASRLPPDTSLRLVEERGTLRVCVPEAYPPLVTSDPSMPGTDVELLELVADRLGVRLDLVPIPEIGRDFNPRSWRITRAQCEVIAGGVVVTEETRSFLETTPAHLETAWAVVSRAGHEGPLLDGADVGFVPGVTGLDRIALSSHLRERNATVTLFQDPTQASAALAAGDIDALVTEGLLGRQLAAERPWSVDYLGEPLERYPLAFGLWKGDLTLKRALVSALRELEASGELDEILARYSLESASSACKTCL